MASTINVAANRIDPYKNFKFKVKWDGQYVAGVNKVSVLKRTTEVIKFREGGSPGSIELMPGQTSYEAITLEAGITTDITFEQWANKVWYYPNTGALGNEVSMQDFRKNITIEVYNEAGQKVLAYNVYNCWPSEYTAVPELEGQGSSVAIQTLVLQNEGWTRDDSVVGATQLTDLPQFDLPPTSS